MYASVPSPTVTHLYSSTEVYGTPLYSNVYQRLSISRIGEYRWEAYHTPSPTVDVRVSRVGPHPGSPSLRIDGLRGTRNFGSVELHSLRLSQGVYPRAITLSQIALTE
ncbi:hypothetical protein FB451DRAFT_1567579 [Mycena latifolia]|nr:hypothetical protein FB451DRAFT_1567579 [Mycena latifolia]